jgi:hypothetical protein
MSVKMVRTIQVGNSIPSLENTSFFFVSCDGQNTKKYKNSNPISVYSTKDDTDMWKKLYNDICADPNPHKYVIHLGDQVYLDDAHDALMENGTMNDAQTVLRTYYDVYDKSFNNLYKKRILESCYNVMMGDDHDIIDNYKSVENNLTPTMLNSAMLMYKAFQDDLCDTNGLGSSIKHITGADFQVIIPDLRKHRRLITEKIDFPIMGKTQFDELSSIVQRTPSSISKTIYASTIPLVGVNSTLDTTIGLLSGNKTVNIDDYISSASYLRERAMVLDKLFELNNVTVVGGDYHYAEHYELSKNGKTVHQFTTSPISSDPITLRNPWCEQVLFSTLVRFMYDWNVDDNISVDKKWSVFDYNYLKMANGSAALCCYNSENNKTENYY